MSTQWTSSGEFRHQAKFQSPSGSSDNFGQQSQTWATYYSPWAKVEVLKGQMLYETEEFIEQSTYMVTIHYPATSGIEISALDRILCNGLTFVIDSVMNVEQINRELRILCHVIDESD
jgi:SPP1 family predicted phage head-tail adaptor